MSSKSPTSRAATVAIGIALISTIFSGIGLEAGGLWLSIERLALIAILPLLVISVATGPRKVDAAVLATLFIFLVETMATGGNEWMKRYAIYAGPMMFTMVAARWRPTLHEFKKWVPRFAAIFFISSLLMYAIGPAVFPFAFEETRFRSVLFEPNIYGAFIAFLLLLAVPNAQGRAWQTLLILSGLGSLIIGFSKGPLIGLFAGVTCLYLLRAGKIQINRVLAVFAFMLPLATVAFSISKTSWYDDNLQREQTTYLRWEIVKDGFEQFLTSPVIGHGPISYGSNSFDLLITMGSDNEKNLWLSQLQVSYLHDFGIVGWLVIHALLLYGFIGSRGLPRDVRSAAAAAFLSIYVAAQFTSTHTLGLFWMSFGLLFMKFSPSLVPVKDAKRES